MILYLAIFKAWIMPVPKCMNSKDNCEGGRQNKYVDTLQKFFPLLWDRFMRRCRTS